MGALHQGHLSLIHRAREECDVVVVTIFVNPTQFAPEEDLDTYPRTLESDLAECSTAGVDLVFCPDVETLYPDHYSTYIEENKISTVLEGEFRPGHFRGVATIVLKLLNIVQPDFAYFGQKDYQQQLLVRKMCEDLNVPVDIRTCPTVREEDGLALSSRNRYLSDGERETALAISRYLRETRQQWQEGLENLDRIRSDLLEKLSNTEKMKVDYACVVDAQTLAEAESPAEKMVALVAAHVGKTRLIDNMILKRSSVLNTP